MQGLVNLGNQVAIVLAVMLPTFCYCAALGWFLFGAWGLWQQAQPHNPFRGKPWIPYVSIILSGVAAAFDRILTMANRSGGSTMTVGLSSNLTSYTTGVTANTLLGTTPGDAIVNIIGIFALFFQCAGAMFCFLAMVAWRSSINGASNRTRSGCGIQFVFGVILMNIVTVTAWLVATLTI